MNKEIRKILILERNNNNFQLLEQLLKKYNIECEGTSDYEIFEKKINENFNYKIVLIDITGLDNKIWNYCKMLYSNNIPFILLSGLNLNLVRKHEVGFRAYAIMQKPILINDFLTTIMSVFNE